MSEAHFTDNMVNQFLFRRCAMMESTISYTLRCFFVGMGLDENFLRFISSSKRRHERMCARYVVEFSEDESNFIVSDIKKESELR